MGGPAPASAKTIFISYAHVDVEHARSLKDALTSLGYDVWWDEDLLSTEAFRIRIGDVVTSAAAVIVIWSDASIRSHWVREESLTGVLDEKLVATCIDGFSLSRVPYGFREFNVERVSNTNAILRALAKLEIRVDGAQPKSMRTANPTNLISPQPDSAPEHSAIATTATPESTTTESGATKFTRQSPARTMTAIAVFLITFSVGFCVIIAAGLINVGFVTWEPSLGGDAALDTGAKQVGFIPALNWSLTAVVLLPLAWSLIFLALSELRRAGREMVQRRMILTTDLDPITAEHPDFLRMQKHIGRFVVFSMLFVSSLALSYAAVDYHQVVASIADSPAEHRKINVISEVSGGDGYPLDHPSLERDWSIAAYLDRRDPVSTDPDANRYFDITVYALYAGVGVGSLFSFMFILIGVGLAFFPGVTHAYRLTVIPDLNSKDRRRGFEALGAFFGYGLAVFFIVMIVCYFMSAQNIYMRTSDSNILSFYLPDVWMIQAFVQDPSREALDQITGYLFSENTPSTAPQNVFTWVIFAFIVIGFLGGFYLFLRQAASAGRRVVFDELENIGVARLRRITNLSDEEIRQRLKRIRVWPTDSPGMLTVVAVVIMFLASFVFYKVGVLVIVFLSLVALSRVMAGNS